MFDILKLLGQTKYVEVISFCVTLLNHPFDLIDNLNARIMLTTTWVSKHAYCYAEQVLFHLYFDNSMST